MAMLFIYPLRGRSPRLSQVNYALILAAIVAMAVTDLMIAPPGGWEAGWFFLCLDMACGVMLWPDRWLRAVFFDPPCQQYRVMRNGR